MARSSPPNRMRVVGYARVSTPEQAGGYSPDGQAQKIAMYCELHGLELVAPVFSDLGESGKDLRRPGMQAALAELAEGRAVGLVISKLDRMTRSVRDLDHLLERYFKEGRGFNLFSVGDSIDTTTASGRFALTLLVSVAQWERETIVERVQGGHDDARRAGTKAGTVPYGRRAVPTDSRKRKPLEDDPAETAVVGRILAERAAGRSLRSIAAGLDADGVPTKTPAGVWTHQMVARVHGGGRWPGSHADGGPVGYTAQTVERIEADRDAGLSFARIADGLKSDDWPVPPFPPRWSHSSIRSILERHAKNEAIIRPTESDRGEGEGREQTRAG